MRTLSNATIVIPVYNCERYLREAIDSALKQDCEVIVINDGSTDRTAEIINSYGSQIKAIHQANGGTAKALNTGIKAASNDWIKWLSADDVFKPGIVQRLIIEAEKYADPKDRIFYTHYDVIDEQGKKLRTFIEPDNSKNSKAVLLDHFYGNGSTSVIHKELFQKCGLFDETLGYQEDYEFWLRAVLLHDIKLTLIDYNSLSYRVHAGQLTEQKRGDSLKKSAFIRNKILEQAPQYKELVGKLPVPLKLRLKRKLRSLRYQ